MSMWMRNFLVICAKNALNAVITNVGLITLFHSTFNTTSWQGWFNLIKAGIIVILGREAAVWGPILLNWSKTNADPVQLMTTIPKAPAQTVIPKR